MSIQELTLYFTQYGAFFVFLIVLLEYLNLPGFPAGVIMPLAGIWASRADTFPCSVASVRRSRAYWQLDLVFSWKTRR